MTYGQLVGELLIAIVVTIIWAVYKGNQGNYRWMWIPVGLLICINQIMIFTEAKWRVF